VKIFEEPNLLASAVHTAFYKHFPIRFNPNIIWITIAQGFAQYVLKNAEALRKKFVSFEGKTKLVISRPNFELGKKMIGQMYFQNSQH